MQVSVWSIVDTDGSYDFKKKIWNFFLYRDQFFPRKQCRPRSNITFCIISSESSLLNKSQPGWERYSMSEYSEKEQTNESAFCRLLIFKKSSFFKKNPFRITISVKQFGPRSGPTFCRARSGSKLFAKVISRRH